VAALRFTWDREKAKRSLEKHGVAFAEAETVFYDEHALKSTIPTNRSGKSAF
jgi:uncharacterized DUF497 family protein